MTENYDFCTQVGDPLEGGRFKWNEDGSYTPECTTCGWEGRYRLVTWDATSAVRSHLKSKRHAEQLAHLKEKMESRAQIVELSFYEMGFPRWRFHECSDCNPRNHQGEDDWVAPDGEKYEKPFGILMPESIGEGDVEVCPRCGSEGSMCMHGTAVRLEAFK